MMEIGEKEFTVGGFVVSWVVGIFGVGKAYGRLSGRVSENEKDMAEYKLSNQKDIDDIKALFRTSDGEPRLVSYKAHDKIQEACQGVIFLRLNDHGDQLKKHDKKLDDILDAVHELNVSINKG